MAELTEVNNTEAITMCEHLHYDDGKEAVGMVSHGVPRWECLKCVLRKVRTRLWAPYYIGQTLHVDNLSPAGQMELKAAINKAIDRESAARGKALSSEGGSYYVAPNK